MSHHPYSADRSHYGDQSGSVEPELYRVVLSIEVGSDAPADLLDDLTSRVEALSPFHVCLMDDHWLAAYYAVAADSSAHAADRVIEAAGVERLIPDELLVGPLRAPAPEAAYRVAVRLDLQLQ